MQTQQIVTEPYINYLETTTLDDRETKPWYLLLGVGLFLRKSNTCKADTHVGKEARVRQAHMQENKHL
jgi:hypothetical protein